MKKNNSFLALGLLALITTTSMSAVAQADYCRYDCHRGGGNPVAVISALLVTLDLYSLSTTAAQDNRAVYVQQVHEDAAAYLADGTQTALLDEAVQNTEQAMQAQGQTADETQIATALISYQ